MSLTTHGMGIPSTLTESDKFALEAALAMYPPGNTVPLTAADRAEIAGVDLVPLLRAGVEMGLENYLGRDKVLQSMNDTGT
jgi:hypothetical protein